MIDLVKMLWVTMVRVRVANELGAGNGKGAKFATMVAVGTSVIIGIFLWIIIITFDTQIAFIFTSSEVVLKEVKKLTILLAFTILLNSVQPVLSGTISITSNFYLFFIFLDRQSLGKFINFFKKLQKNILKERVRKFRKKKT